MFTDLFSQEYWVRQPSPTFSWLKRCTFTDTSNGWAAGDSGVIIHTSNGGQSWITQHSGIDYFITYIFFLNSRLGWAIANNYLNQGTTILKTADGGNNWSYSLFPDTVTLFQAIYFVDSLIGYLGGQYGTVLKTSNAGQSWSRCILDSGTYSQRMIYRFSFYNSQFGFAVGGTYDAGGVVWRSTDFGSHWQSQYVCPEPLFDIALVDSLEAIGCGGDYEVGAEVVKTIDEGTTWNFKLLQMWGTGYSISKRTRNEYWAALGYGAYLELSTDTGNSFYPIPIPDTAGIYDIRFIDPEHGWAVGVYGSIYKYNKDIIGINNNKGNIPKEFQLYQNYPNPFNTNTKIRYSLAQKSKVRLSIYDILGNEVTVLVNTNQNPGIYEVNFDGSNFASGIYFYKIQADEYVKTNKMVLLK